MEKLKKGKTIFAVSAALALLLFVNVGFVAVYHVVKMNWYHQQLVEKPGEETVTLHLTKAEFENCRTKRYEWKINGESYDMRSYTVSDSGVTVIAVHDMYEHELMNILTAGFTNEDDQPSQPVHHWVKVFTSPALMVEKLAVQCFSYCIDVKFIIAIFYSRLHNPELIDPPSFLS